MNTGAPAVRFHMEHVLRDGGTEVKRTYWTRQEEVR